MKRIDLEETILQFIDAAGHLTEAEKEKVKKMTEEELISYGKTIGCL